MCLLLLSTSSSPFSLNQNLNHTQSPIKSNHFFVAVVTVYMVDVVIVSVVVWVTVAVAVIVAVPFSFVFGCRCCFKMSCFCLPAPVSSLFPSQWSMLGLSIEIWKWGGVERNLFQLTLPSFYCFFQSFANIFLVNFSSIVSLRRSCFLESIRIAHWKIGL